MVLVLGEIQTALLPHSRPLTPEEARSALALAVGEGVTQWARPVPHTASPTLLHGVDCKLPLGPKPGRRHTDPNGDNGTVRSVGTVCSRAVLTSGHLLQGSAWTVVSPQERPRRMPWSYYLARPGTVHPIGNPEIRRLAEGFLYADARHDRSGLLDTAAIARHSSRDVLSRPVLDQRPPIKTGSTRLRWAAIADPGSKSAVAFRLVGTDRRRLSLVTGTIDPERIASAAEDLAVHDWLLTAVAARISLAKIGEDSRRTLRMLRPVVDHLIHLWSPGARTSHDLGFVWDVLERRPGLTRQWNTMTERVRSQIDYGAADLADKVLSIIEQNPQLLQRGDDRY
ncbi:SCO2521 family protein [Glycomyces sp. L485]|uniref:SCO2521 family protein n=1 Tax=Glycomyces sp. L485 TaxID=2909235 RepID=UPI001F4B93ED|nr:SCO2521 family protein [Glycomyces sp. L485]MCH7231961.1 SCO2521 family protein [Glycomyces sp. L485]